MDQGLQNGDDKLASSVYSKMFEQMQEQQATLASALSNNPAVRQLGDNKILLNGDVTNLMGLPLPILQMTRSVDCEGPDGFESGDEVRASGDNFLVNSCDCGDYDDDLRADCSFDEYLSWYCGDDGEAHQCADQVEESDEECNTLVNCSVDCCEEESTCSDSTSDSSQGEPCGVTVITMKDAASAEGKGGGAAFGDEASTVETQTAPTSESKGVQVTEMRTTASETDPVASFEPLDEVFDRTFSNRLGPRAMRSMPQLNRQQRPEANDNRFAKSRTFSNFDAIEPSPPPNQWRRSPIMSNAPFEEDRNVVVIEPEPPRKVTPEPPPREPIFVKFDLAMRIDSVRDLPHLLAAPHGNDEHYCAYCTPNNEALVRPPMLVKARLTLYDRSTGHLVVCDEGPVNSETNWAITNVRHNRYVFGRQSAVFPRTIMSQDSIILIRLYAQSKRDLLEIDPSYSLLVRQAAMEATEGSLSEDDLIGWAVMYVFDAYDEGKDGETWKLKDGRLLLPLYAPPVPMIIQIPPQVSFTGNKWKSFRRLGAHSKVAVWVQRGPFKNLDDSSEESDVEDDDEVRQIDKKLWVDGGPQPRLTEPFTTQDGFDLYVDGARCLPDFVTITKLTVRIAQANHSKAASDECCYSQLDSDIFNPVYDYRIEYRNLAREVVPRSTVTFKMYTIDRFTHKLTIVGYAYLNLFNNLGVVGQPVVDQGVQVALNEGAFQIRIYATPPCENVPLSVQLPVTDKHRPWPCTSLLVRIVKAPKDDFGKVLSMNDVPESQWEQSGVLKRRPKSYTTGSYLSKASKPGVGERQAYATFRRRLPFPCRKAVVELGRQVADRTIPDDNDVLLKSVLERLLSRFGLDNAEAIPHGSPDFAVAYDPSYGFSVSIDSAIGLPWAGATFGHLVVNPPGAHYLGPPFTRFDIPKFLVHLDLSSPPSAPRWVDGFIRFSHRSGQRMQSTGLRVTTVVVVHLQEVTIRRTYMNFEYGLSSEAWAVVPIFSKISSFSHPYVANEKLLLPIFAGPPSLALLKEMSSVVNLAEWLDNCIHVKKLHPVVGARLFVRVCDARRRDECTLSDDYLHFNNIYATLPSILEAEPPSLVPILPPALTSVPLQAYLSALVTHDQNFLDKITTSLPKKYRQMVFKLYYSLLSR